MVEPPYGVIWNRLRHGKVIPFLGAGAVVVNGARRTIQPLQDGVNYLSVDGDSIRIARTDLGNSIMQVSFNPAEQLTARISVRSNVSNIKFIAKTSDYTYLQYDLPAS